ncbi:Dolichol kinase [Symbiodinium microadriaticum]|uniref:dolichol kinase n=1 Tax=Symbiodinium microadriaticum TaxID=2951 RepID=A0A1Q9F6L4_SYMMI|nr:Dolichol kinase [Symbiodinium microadriaticum]
MANASPDAGKGALLLVEDLLALASLGALPSRPLCIFFVVVVALAIAIMRRTGHCQRGGRGGLLFAGLLGPILAAGYSDDSVWLVGCAADPVLWSLASVDALVSLAMAKVPSWITLLGSIIVAKGASLPLAPATAFLSVQHLVMSFCLAEDWGCCLTLAEKLLWSQGAGFLCAVLSEAAQTRFHGWPPLLAFFMALAALGLFLLLMTRLFWRLLPSRIQAWAAVLSTAVTGGVVLLWGLTGAGTGEAFELQPPLLWLLRYILQPSERRTLFLQWPLLLIAGVVGADVLSRRLASASKGRPSNRDKHFVRKTFHALALALFVPPLCEGLAPFLSLSLLIAALLFLLLETLRFYKTPHLAALLDGFLGQYLDKREDIARGDLVLTHLYLLLGCALPIWLEGSLVLPFSPDTASAFRQWGGLLLIGVGDSCAAIVGILFGRHAWPGSHRTLEGSAAFLAGVLFGSACLLTASGRGITSLPAELPALLVATVLSALLEVYTESFDNLVLPLFFCPLLKSLQVRL